MCVLEIQSNILVAVLKFQKWLLQSGLDGTDRDFETSPRTEIRGGSCCGSRIGWTGKIYIFGAGYVKTHSTTPIPLISVNFR